ncbi:MAG: dUTP diphosphatase [Ruminococcus sp.]|nr:dUTP diphosphatase [Ruminococcus sp.]
MRLLFKKLRDGAIIPKRQTEFSAGCDLCACLENPVTVEPQTTVKIPTGLAAELEGEKNAVLLIYARSSLATKFGIAPANCVGVVDWDYRGELIVALHNSSDKAYTIADGDRIAQLVITPILTPEICEVDELSDTVRGEGGFGSTGKR